MPDPEAIHKVGLGEIARQRHGIAAGMGSADQLFRIGTNLVFEARTVRNILCGLLIAYANDTFPRFQSPLPFG